MDTECSEKFYSLNEYIHLSFHQVTKVSIIERFRREYM